MSKFQQLVKGAASAIRKAQEELRALSAPEAQQVPEPPPAPKEPTLEERLAKVAKNTLGDVPAGFKMYHGSPHEFDKFDFVNNLKKGEGALAFGPGGYLTGHEPLAREYASTLAMRSRAGLSPYAADLLNNHKDDFMEFLRLGNAARIARTNPAFEHDMPRVLATSDRRIFKPGPVASRWNYQRDVSRQGPYTRVVTPHNFQAYLSTMRRELGKDLEEISKLKLHNARAARNARDMGFDARQIMKSGEIEAPRLSTRLYKGPPKEAHRSDAVNVESVENPYGGRGTDIQTRNLHNLNDAIAGNPGGRPNLPYSFGMKSRTDLSRPVYSASGRNLYEIDSPFAPADMIPYDYPLEHASPRVLGALSRLFDGPYRNSLLDIQRVRRFRSNPEDPELWRGMTGETLMSNLKALDHKAAANLMKDAGIPGMYYLRGGRRFGAGTAPRGFDPEDYNFVIFDDEKLPIPKRTKFADGGAVVKS
jgi:hypothetical protein